VEGLTSSLLIVLDHPQKPRNIGAVCRVAAALGAELLVIGTSLQRDPYRQAMAAVGNSVQRHACDDFESALAFCRERGLRCVGSSSRGGDPLWSLPLGENVALFFGHEVGGLSAAKLGRLDAKLMIPMAAGVDSLNLACSVAVLGYEWLRRQQGQGL
jgi:tRNA G18 (ribose-2'-O)-methylase SpoU